ncbi:MAG: SufD family Fe-S cluster assembly protein [Candidatus Izemoplasmatales bacterium]
MEIVKYLVNNPNLIAFDNQEIINNAKISIKNNHLLFQSGKEFFIFLDNYDKYSELNFDIKENQNVKIYLITYQSRNLKIKYNFNVSSNAKLEVFTNFLSKRKTTASISLDFTLGENAYLKLLNALTFKGRIELASLVNLNGKNAKTEIELLNVGGNDSEYFVNQTVNHNEIATLSDINNWLISTENSKLKYTVTGKIVKGMEHSKCHQSNKGIMLASDSEIMVEPKLLIDEYDVEASHGAAIGQMDELQLYYLLSRGLSVQEAKSLIITGYTNPFINMINNQEVAKQLSSQISRLIRRKTNNE